MSPLAILAVFLFIFILILLLRLYVKGGQCRCKGRLDGRTVLITGANTGIGKETARVLADRGARVILACRNMAAAYAAVDCIHKAIGRSAQLVAMELDLADMQSVRTFAKSFMECEERLDILINNAGVMRCPKSRTVQGFEMQYGVNHLGHFLLTNLLLPMLRTSGCKDAPSRIINVSSLGHKRGKLDFDDLNLVKQADADYDPRQVYCNSKLMNILFTRELTRRFHQTGDKNVVATCLHPGVIFTDLGRHMFKQHSRAFMTIIVNPVCRLLLKTPVQGAQTTIHLALSPDAHGDAGKYFADCKAVSCAKAAYDDDAAARLWSVSENACCDFL